MGSRTKSIATRSGLLPVLLTLGACAGEQPPIPPVEYVDIERFMGDWYVIANIPTFLEKGAHNAVETYELNTDGSIATTFVFRKNAFDGDRKVHTPVGYVVDTQSNAIWGMQFVWPIKADYRIVYLADDYSSTVIARNKRDYVWIMSRNPSMEETEYNRLSDFVESLGYDISKLEKVPQQW